MESIKPIIQTSQRDLRSAEMKRQGIIAAIVVGGLLVLWGLVKLMRH